MAPSSWPRTGRENKFQSQFSGWDLWVHYHYLTQTVHYPFIHNPEVIWSPYQFITASEVSLSKELTIAKLPHDLVGSLCLFMGMLDYYHVSTIGTTLNKQKYKNKQQNNNIVEKSWKKIFCLNSSSFLWFHVHPILSSSYSQCDPRFLILRICSVTPQFSVLHFHSVSRPPLMMTVEVWRSIPQEPHVMLSARVFIHCFLIAENFRDLHARYITGTYLHNTLSIYNHKYLRNINIAKWITYNHYKYIPP